jgi:hypothetical protein
MSVRVPTLAADGYCLQVAGWGDFGPVTLFLDGEHLVCSACNVRPSTVIRLVHAAGEPNQAACGIKAEYAGKVQRLL